MGSSILDVKINELIKKEFPKLKIMKKSDSWFMRFIGFFIQIFNKDFDNYVVSMPPYRIFVNDKKTWWGTLAHEYVHCCDFRDRPFRYIFGYGFPQILAPLAFVGLIGLIWTPWAWLSLALLLTLIPFPSPGRVRDEARGYAMTRLCYQLQFGKELDVEAFKDQFVGWSYYRMSWNWKKARQEILNVSLDDLPYQKIKAFFE